MALPVLLSNMMQAIPPIARAPNHVSTRRFFERTIFRMVTIECVDLLMYSVISLSSIGVVKDLSSLRPVRVDVELS